MPPPPPPRPFELNKKEALRHVDFIRPRGLTPAPFLPSRWPRTSLEFRVSSFIFCLSSVSLDAVKGFSFRLPAEKPVHLACIVIRGRIDRVYCALLPLLPLSPAMMVARAHVHLSLAMLSL